MQAISQGDGCYWKTDDQAGLSFNEVNHGGNPPSGVRCYNLHDTLNDGEESRMPLSAMGLIGIGEFTDARVRKVRYTGQSHKYGIYLCTPEHGRKCIVILVAHGAGMRGYRLTQLWAVELWCNLCTTLSTDDLWSLCHQVIDAYDEGRSAEKRKLLTAFAEGRMKKRRKGGRVTVDIIAA